MDKKALLTPGGSREWETPWELFRKIDSLYHFTLDVCATPENKKCERFFSKADDGLAQEWKGVCWMNPPYGRDVEPWIKKAYKAADSGAAVVVALLPARTDTKWFHRYIYGKAEVRFLEGRVKYVRKDGKSGPAPFPSMIVVWNKRRKNKLWQGKT